MTENQSGVELKNVERLSSTKVKLTIHLAKERVSAQEEAAAKHFVQTAKLPGFRPGKVPVSVVKQRFKDDIRQETLSNLLEQGLHFGVEKSKLIPINRPEIQIKTDLGANGGSFEFDAEFEIRPEFDLPNYTSFKIDSETPQVEDKEVDETLGMLRDRLSVLEPAGVDTPFKGSFLVVEMAMEWLDETPPKKDPPKAFTVEVGEDKLLPELEKGLLEMKVDGKKSIEAVFPEEYSDPKLKGKKVLFHCHLMEVKRKKLPELNDQFAEQIKPGSTLLSLRGEIREDILRQKNDAAGAKKREEILTLLVKQTQLDVPQSIKESNVASIKARLEEDMRKNGATQIEYKPEDLKAIEEKADFQSRASLILSKIAEKEEIRIDESEVQNRVSHIAGQLQMPVDQANQQLRERGLLQKLRDEVLTDQVFNRLIEKIQIVDKAPSKIITP